MNKDKQHYLKLKEDFFKQDKVAILENGKHGFLFSNILLKLYLLSLKNNGDLLLSSEVKFTGEMIADLTGHKIAIVEQALVRFKELDLMKETENNSLSMTDFQLFHETSTAEAEKKKAYRHKVKMGQFEPNVPEVSQDCPDKVPEKSTECHTDVLGTSVDVTETSLENPITVPVLSQDSHDDRGELSQIGDSEVPKKSDGSPDLSQHEDKSVPEVEQQPYSFSSPMSKKSGDEIPTFPKPKPLKIAKKPVGKEQTRGTLESDKKQSKNKITDTKETDSTESGT